MNWTHPKRLVLNRNVLDGPKSFWNHRRTRHYCPDLYSVPSVQLPQGTLRGPTQYATQHKKSLIEEALGYFLAVALLDGPGRPGPGTLNILRIKWLILQIKEYETNALFHQLGQNLIMESLTIYMFCKSCGTEIVPPVLQVKSKTVSRLQLIQNM